jgi:hypothetical protein
MRYVKYEDTRTEVRVKKIKSESEELKIRLSVPLANGKRRHGLEQLQVLCCG